MRSSRPRSVRFSRLIVAAMLLPAALLHGVAPSTFAWSGTSAVDAIPVEPDHLFFGTADAGKSAWFCFSYDGGNEDAVVSLAYPPNWGNPSLSMFTGGPNQLRQENINAKPDPATRAWNGVVSVDYGLSIRFKDPNPRDVFVQITNHRTDRQPMGFVGQLGDPHPSFTLQAPATSANPPPGPVADTPQNAITLGAGAADQNFFRGFAGTLGPQRVVWYRFYHPGTEPVLAHAQFASWNNVLDQEPRVYVGSDLNNLKAVELDRPMPPTPQFVYVKLTNITGEIVAYGGGVGPVAAPPGAPAVQPLQTGGTFAPTPRVGCKERPGGPAGVGVEVTPPVKVVDAQLDLSKLSLPPIVPTPQTAHPTAPAEQPAPPATQPAPPTKQPAPPIAQQPAATPAQQPAPPVAQQPAPAAQQLGALATAPDVAHDALYFIQTGFRIDDQFLDLFKARGGIDAFGFPVSRAFRFLGCPVQIFQRLIAQDCAGQGPALLNLLDPEIFPYTRVNGSVFPSPDDGLKNATPQVGTAEYAGILDFIAANTPDTFEGEPVNFHQTFAARGGLETWGAVISPPQRDPTNPDFIYQRFQRGIMHYRHGLGTESILLADYLKAILADGSHMSGDLPADLSDQAQDSRFVAQYCPSEPHWVCRPSDLGPGNDLTFAFEPG